MDGVVVVDGFVRFGGIGFGTGVRVVDLSPSISFLTVSVILGWAGLDDFGRGGSGIFANEGAEICGEDDWGCFRVGDRSSDIFGTLENCEGVGILGRLRLSVSSILGDGRVLDGVVAGCAFWNGVTALKDGMAGAGFTVG